MRSRDLQVLSGHRTPKDPAGVCLAPPEGVVSECSPPGSCASKQNPQPHPPTPNLQIYSPLFPTYLRVGKEREGRRRVCRSLEKEKHFMLFFSRKAYLCTYEALPSVSRPAGPPKAHPRICNKKPQCGHPRGFKVRAWQRAPTPRGPCSLVSSPGGHAVHQAGLEVLSDETQPQGKASGVSAQERPGQAGNVQSQVDPVGALSARVSAPRAQERAQAPRAKAAS